MVSRAGRGAYHCLGMDDVLRLTQQARCYAKKNFLAKTQRFLIIFLGVLGEDSVAKG